jgi:hypothetical protein
MKISQETLCQTSNRQKAAEMNKNDVYSGYGFFDDVSIAAEYIRYERLAEAERYCRLHRQFR